jgi:hypothetical protein
LRVEVHPDDNKSEKLAALATDGALTAITLQAYSGGGKELGVTELLAAMRKAGDETVAGDMGRFERVLTHQFLTLDALFNNLAQRSGRQDSFKGIEVLMRLALKAQSQARATAETLALIKNPMPYIGKPTLPTAPSRSTTALPRAREKIKVHQTNYWSTSMATPWTLERRQRQAELIRQWQPWQQSTGPRTPEGKAAASRNAWQGGHRAQLRELTQALNAELAEMRRINNMARS